MTNIKLSILIPTVPSRLESFFPKIIRTFEKQVGDRKDVEILGFYDNKKRSVGSKRQTLLDMANGEYLVFIDDDDDISEKYIDIVMETLYNNPETDCVVYDCICTVNNANPLHCKYGIEYEYHQDGSNWWGKPAHTMIYRSKIAKSHRFDNKNFGEDVDWVKRACKDIKIQTRIDEILYYYKFNESTTETR